jgi:hypothetical protein
MRRFKVVGLCLVAVFALSAFMVSGAQAAKMGTCVKAAKSGKAWTGKFTDKLCTKPASPTEITEGKTNKYEFAPIPAGIKFKVLGTDQPTLKSAAGNITCTSDSAEGESVGSEGTQSHIKFKFTSCVLSATSGKCTGGMGAAEGEIITNGLTSTLVGHGQKGPGGKEPAMGEAWTSVAPTPPETYSAEFTCAPGVPFKVKGNVAGKISPLNVQTKAGKEGKKPKFTFEGEYAETVGEQNLESTFFEPVKKESLTVPSVQEGKGGIIYPLKKLEVDEFA